jgi:hypothetical protein
MPLLKTGQVNSGPDSQKTKSICKSARPESRNGSDHCHTVSARLPFSSIGGGASCRARGQIFRSYGCGDITARINGVSFETWADEQQCITNKEAVKPDIIGSLGDIRYYPSSPGHCREACKVDDDDDDDVLC